MQLNALETKKSLVKLSNLWFVNGILTAYINQSEISINCFTFAFGISQVIKEEEKLWEKICSEMRDKMRAFESEKFETSNREYESQIGKWKPLQPVKT